MSIFRRNPEKNALSTPPAQEAKKEVKLVGNFKVESQNKEDLENILLSGGKITVLVNPKTEKIILGTSGDLYKDPKLALGESQQWLQYSYSAKEFTTVGKNRIPKGELNLLNPESAAIIEQATGMTEPNARKILEGKTKEHLALNANDSPIRIEKKPFVTPPTQKNSIDNHKNEYEEFKKLQKIKEIQDSIEGKI